MPYKLFIVVAAVATSCGSEPEPIREIGPAENKIHLLPFQCSYLGFKLNELEGCSIACPGRIFAEYDIEKFTANMVCSHPYYGHLQCGVDR